MFECCCRTQLRKEQWEGNSGQAAEEQGFVEALPQSGCSALGASVALPAVRQFWLVLPWLFFFRQVQLFPSSPAILSSHTLKIRFSLKYVVVQDSPEKRHCHCLRPF